MMWSWFSAAFGSEWVLGIIAGVLLASFAQWLSHWLRLREEHRGRIVDVYSEFVGVVSDDVERAKSVKAFLDVGLPGSDTADDTFPRWIKALSEMDASRHKHRSELVRLAMLIEVFERDTQLIQLTTTLSASVPFFFHQPFSSGRGAWQNSLQRDKQEERFAKDIEEFRELFRQFRALVGSKYRTKWYGAW